MAMGSVLFRVFHLFISVPLLVNAVTPLDQTDLISQITDLKKEFQTKMEYMFQVMKEKDDIHTMEIANLQRQVDILHDRCSKNNLTPESPWSKTVTNTTQQEIVPEARDRRSFFTSQRTARVGPDNRNNVAFYSYLGTRLTNLGNNQPIIFNHVVTNLANRYDENSGIFHCGIPGVYVFNVHLLAVPGKDINTQLVKNGGMISAIYAGGQSGTYDHGGNTAIIELAVGDKVWVRVLSDTDQAAILDFVYSSFSGFLLYPY
ncbi:complement C1q tumor necrosis factor-related protein 4-like [Pecten maximus]|uniref:complement C1q tumor necrosis factor-related protein 4-like n=1 Tax=Pecten maximus TaxID=6579 RepID=UPI00145852B9|nr:complement C1q tumor necrosis factor-related protein 4-like [Pecten maximus]